nr:redoxin domain-containing protein [Nannocystis sp. ILAH1]
MAALAEAEDRIADAEALLAEGLSRWRGEEICDKPLKRLYQRQHGDDRGYAAHRQKLEAAVRDRRRAALLSTAIAEPKPLPPFVLPRLGGGEVRSESLRGRIAVINVWAKWCGPCVAEMSALQTSPTRSPARRTSSSAPSTSTPRPTTSPRGWPSAASGSRSCSALVTPEITATTPCR